MSAIDGDKRAITINEIHYKVHDGQLFNVSHRATLTSAQVKDFYIVVGSVSVHLISEVRVEGNCYLDLYEDPTYTTTAVTLTTMTSYNFNRNRSNKPKVEFFDANTSTATGGADIKTTAIFAGIRNAKFGGDARAGAEWELARDKTYVLRLTDNSASDNEYTLDFEYYEE